MGSRKHKIVAFPAAIDREAPVPDSVNHTGDGESALLPMVDLDFVDSAGSGNNGVLVIVST